MNNSKKQTILVVDDSPSNINILLELLKDYDVIPCLDGKTAIDIVNKENIDLILLDIIMPDVDGFTVCQILKSDKKNEHIPILFISAKDSIDDISRGFELGGVDYITKPFNTIELKCRVDTHLELISYKVHLETRNQELTLLNEKIKEFAKKEYQSLVNEQNHFLPSGNIDFTNLIDNITLDK